MSCYLDYHYFFFFNSANTNFSILMKNYFNEHYILFYNYNYYNYRGNISKTKYNQNIKINYNNQTL